MCNIFLGEISFVTCSGTIIENNQEVTDQYASNGEFTYYCYNYYDIVFILLLLITVCSKEQLGICLK